MTQDPQVDVAAFLAGAGLSLTLGTNLFRGEVQAVGNSVPAEAVFVEAQPGQAPDPYVGTGVSYWSAEVEITVRGPAGNRETARTKARACLAALHLATISGYVRVVAEDSEPEWLEADEAGCHEYAFSVLVEWDG